MIAQPSALSSYPPPKPQESYSTTFADCNTCTASLFILYSWDRQPYVYRLNESDPNGPLGISPQTQTLRKNMIINLHFTKPSCGSIAVDFDDETSQFNVTENVLLYGGVKCFDGMDRQVWNNLIVAPGVNPNAGPSCFHALSSVRNLSSAHTHFFENTCVFFQTGDYPYRCGAGPAPFYNKTYHVDVHSNHFLYPNATQQPSWSDACKCWPSPDKAPPCPFKTFSDWQRYGHDRNSTISLQYSNQAILGQARSLLGL